MATGRCRLWLLMAGAVCLFAAGCGGKREQESLEYRQWAKEHREIAGYLRKAKAIEEELVLSTISEKNILDDPEEYEWAVFTSVMERLINKQESALDQYRQMTPPQGLYKYHSYRLHANKYLAYAYKAYMRRDFQNVAVHTSSAQILSLKALEELRRIYVESGAPEELTRMVEEKISLSDH